MEDQVSEELKELREKELMILQQEISTEINKLKVGRIYDILVEGYNGEFYSARSEELAPDIDGNILIEGKDIEIGQYVKAKITEALEYDLLGVVCDESCK
jgi:ribosomal protein S12 methylthiotransferase